MSRSRSKRLGPLVLALTVLRHRLLPVLLVAVGSFLMATTVLGVSAVKGSMESAVRTSVEADVAQQPFSVQAGTDRARQAISEVRDLVPVLDSDGDLETGDARTGSSVRTHSDPDLHLGTLLAGEFPSGDGEATVSKAIADTTGAEVGSIVTIIRDGRPDLEATVVGVTVDTADVLDSTTVVVEPGVDASNATVWLSEVDPYSLSALVPLMDARAITYRYTDSATDAAVVNLPVSTSALRAFQWGLGLLLVMTVGGLLFVLAPVARRDVESLVTAGMSASTAWRTVGTVPFAALLVGQVGGLLAVVAVLNLARTPVSEAVGHYWLHVPWPVGTASALIAASVIAVVLLRPALLAFRRAALSMPRAASRLSLGLGGSLVSIGLGLVLLTAGYLGSRMESPPEALGLVVLPGAIAVLLGVPHLVARAVNRAHLPAVGAIQARLHTGMAISAMAAAIVVLWSSGSAASATHDANAFEKASGGSRQEGSLMLTEVPAGAADLIVSEFRDLGGNDVRQYDLADEVADQLRVTGTRLVGCMEQAQTMNADNVPPDCFPQQTSVPVAIVALSRSGESESLADPGLLEEGEVGLIQYEAGQADAKALAITEAIPDALLGGNLPGLVVAPNGPVAKKFGLEPSGTRLIGLMDFIDLSVEDRARLRSVVAQVAPAAQVAESTNIGAYDEERGRANAVALIGAVLAALLLLTGGAGVVLGNKRTRRVLVDLGASSRQRFFVVLTWIAIPVTTMVAAGALAWFSASINGVAMSGSMGTYWLIPSATTLLCCIALSLAMVRVPSHARD